MRRSALLVCGLCAALWSVAPARAADLVKDPWGGLPELTTACYSGQDAFDADAARADTALGAAIERQKVVNAEVHEKLGAQDPMEQARRMQEYMMKHPQDAAKLMQQQQAMGAAMQELVPANGKRAQELDAELDALIAKYDAALTEAYAPANARQKELEQKLAAQGLVIDGEGAPRGALDEAAQLEQERRRAYEAVCPRWWSASGSFHVWLGRYREWLVQDHVPLQEQRDAQALGQFAILGTDGSAYHSTAAMEAARSYLSRATKLFGRRRAQPR